jgi:hypothetical protein
MAVFVYVNTNKQVAAAVMEFTDIRVLENPPSVAVLSDRAPHGSCAGPVAFSRCGSGH